MINKYVEEKGDIGKVKEAFYERITVELDIRDKARDMPKVFFLVLFACCRDSYVP